MPESTPTAPSDNPLPPPPSVPALSEPPPVPTMSVPPPSAVTSGRKIPDQPPGYPNALVWLRAGIVRDWRGVLGAFVATWFYVPIALLFAFWGAVSLGVAGLLGGGMGAADQAPPELLDVPLAGALLDAFLTRSAGVFGGLLGAVAGFLGGFLLVVLLPWYNSFDNPIALMGSLAGTVIAAIVLGLVYTLYRVLLEPRLLLVSGARPLSAREREALEPVLKDCARRLGLPSVPRLLIVDNPVLTNARTYSRHIVITTSLLAEPAHEIEALLGHELVHWRTGDEVTSAFVRGVALPLYLAHALPTWLMRSFPHPATDFFVFLVFWPVLLTMKYLVMPLHSRDVRAAEYRADLGAVRIGRIDALRAILEQRKSFENGRSGWDEAVCATHPVHEQRLDRLEQVDGGTAATSIGDAAPPSRGADDLFGYGSSGGPSRRTLVVALAVLLAGCTVISGLGIVQWAFFRPQAAVNGYFSALEDHDARAALDWLDPAVENALAQDKRLAAMVASEDYEPPTNIDITSVQRDGDEAQADVSYTLAGASTTAQLRLRRDESTSLGLFRGWHIVDGPPSMSGPQQPGLRINGVEVPASEDQVLNLVAFPGLYTATLPTSSLSETPPVPIVVTPEGQPGDLLVTPMPRPDLQTRAEQAVQAHLDRCVQLGRAESAGCPFELGGRSVGRVQWTITERPKIQVELIDATTARVSPQSGGFGAVRASWTGEDYLGGSQRYTNDYTFSVSGMIVANGEQVIFNPEGN